MRKKGAKKKKKKDSQLAIEIVLKRICLFCKECLVIDSNF